MKLGMIGETIVNLMFTYDRIMPPSENTAVNRIGVLFREGLLTQDLVDILHVLTVMMSYIFRAIRLYPVSEELEAEMQKLERDLAALWGTTSWDKNA